MLSAGERPQPPHAPKADSTTPVSKAHIMPDLNGASLQTKNANPDAQLQHIWVVTGPAGCGKSTAGNVLRTHLGVPFLEGDDVSTSAFQSSPTQPNPTLPNQSIATTHTP
jgi:gluconokinase